MACSSDDDRCVFLVNEPGLTGSRVPVECEATELEMLFFRIEFAERYGRPADIRKKNR